VNFELSGSLGPAIAKELPWPPALEISATPNADLLELRNLEGAIHPAAASPSRRAHVPIRMVIERDEHERLRQASNPKRTQMMKVARAIDEKRREAWAEFVEKSFD